MTEKEAKLIADGLHDIANAIRESFIEKDFKNGWGDIFDVNIPMVLRWLVKED